MNSFELNPDVFENNFLSRAPVGLFSQSDIKAKWDLSRKEFVQQVFDQACKAVFVFFWHYATLAEPRWGKHKPWMRAPKAQYVLYT